MGEQPHAVLVPGPGLGHVNGCILLAKALLSAGFCVTLACFERCYKTHASKGCINLPHPSARVEIVPDGLPAEASSYIDLFRITPSMHDNLVHLLRSLSSQQHPATCLISDSIMAWTQHAADEVSIPRVDYWTSNAMNYLTILALPDIISKGYAGSHTGPVPPSWKTENTVLLDCIPGFPDFPLQEVPKDFRYVALEDPLLQRFLETAHLAKDADCVLLHSVYDLEPEAFQALQQAAHIQAFAIGPLFHQYDNDTSAKSSGASALTWLDSRATSSVIYVSFGSNFVHTDDEIAELAHGLEASGKAFLWVIRSDSLEQGHELADVLPRGFKERTAERGLITPWVSQLDVLAHPAVGGFLSHCGWNSTLESVWMGVPILACPKRADQPINSKFIVKEWGVGIELETSLEGSFSRHHVETGVRTLLDGPHGHLARAKARELSHMVRKAPFEGGDSHSNLVEFATKMKKRASNTLI
eukprot:c24407_g4_i2 orf=151-1566(+)